MHGVCFKYVDFISDGVVLFNHTWKEGQSEREGGMEKNISLSCHVSVLSMFVKYSTDTDIKKHGITLIWC